MQPSLTVALPNYNHATYLPKALEALITQSRCADEILLLDDGSTDESVTILKAYAAGHSDIRLICNAKNEGVLPSLNKLLHAAKSDYIYIAAADDYVLPGFFELAMRAAAGHPGAGVIFGDFEIFSDDGRILETVAPILLQSSMFLEPQVFMRDYLGAEPPHRSPGPVAIFNRALLMEVGGYKSEAESWADALVVRELGLRTGACYVKHLCGRFRYSPGTFSGSLSDRPDRLLRIIRHVAKLMRAGDNRRYFPEEMVKKWQRDFLAYAANLSKNRYAGMMTRQRSLLMELIRATTRTGSLERFLFQAVLSVLHGTNRMLGQLLLRRVARQNPTSNSPPPGNES